MVVAFDVLGLPAVSDVLRQLLLWLPNVVVALVVLVIGGLAASALSNVVRAAAAKSALGDPDMLAKVASWLIWASAMVVAVNQMGIATALVNTLFMAVVGAIALALGLAFGLGGRDTAAEIVRGSYPKGQKKGQAGSCCSRCSGEVRQNTAPMNRQPPTSTYTSTPPERGNIR